MEKTIYKIYHDGSCSNSGNKEMGIGLVVWRNGEIHHEMFHNAGKGTSNVAEWIGCVLAMKAGMLLAAEEPECEIYVYSDSQLIVNQFSGEWRIKDEIFVGLKKKAVEYKIQMEANFKGLFWVRRNFNKEADVQSKKVEVAR